MADPRPPRPSKSSQLAMAPESSDLMERMLEAFADVAEQTEAYREEMVKQNRATRLMMGALIMALEAAIEPDEDGGGDDDDEEDEDFDPGPDYDPEGVVSEEEIPPVSRDIMLEFDRRGLAIDV